MFRRIEIISTFKHKDGTSVVFKSGLMGVMSAGVDADLEIFDAWAVGMGAPKHLNKNCRFYFTQLGWEVMGRNTIAKLQEHKVDYRVIAIKECSVDVAWRDEHQVAVRARKKRN